MSKEFYDWLSHFSDCDGSEVAVTPETQFIGKELTEKFSECLESLSIRDVYVLDKYAEFVERNEQKITYEQLATALNLGSEDAVKQRMYRIRKDIQTCLEIKYDWIKIRQ